VPEPHLSVVVCTHDRPLDLAGCLDALALLDSPVEVVVVDSASDPPCTGLVERYANAIPGIRYVREDRPGLSRARNRGIREARGDLVAFIDDDTAPTPSWARYMVEAFDADEAVGCVGGACIAVFEDASRRPKWLSDRLLQFAGITRFGVRAREARSSAEWPFGANVAFRVEALPGEQPFLHELGRVGGNLLSGEEWALVEIVRAAGWKIWLEPRATVEHTVHAERCESRYYWRRLWWAGVSRARSTNADTRLALRLIGAAPVRLCLYALTRDRVYLYRTAETAGYLAERARLLLRTAP
jgi:glycosyltransferase involved in cell wall biosynthesis